MNIRLSVSLAVALGALASQQALGQLTLKLKAPLSQANGTLTSSGGGVNWTMNYFKPKVVPSKGDIDKNSDQELVDSFNLWNKANGNMYQALNFEPMTAAILTVQKYIPTLSDSGLASLVMTMGLSYREGTKTGPGTPNPPIPNGLPGNGDANWLECVTTNLWTPIAKSQTVEAGEEYPDGRSYLDLLRGVPNAPPTWPVQANKSRFLDDPARQGVVGDTIFWYGDSILCSITPAKGKVKAVVNVYGDVYWGFEVTGVKGKQQGSLFPPSPLDTDYGKFGKGIPQTVPEPASTAVLGMGVLGACLVRKKKKR